MKIQVLINSRAMQNRIKQELIKSHQRQNWLQTVLMLGGMIGILALLGWALPLADGVLIMLIVGIAFFVFTSRVSSRWVLRMYKARRIRESEAQDLFALLRELTRRAGLDRMPDVFYIPSRMLNAFVVGKKHEAALGLTDGLLRSLSYRELAAVLAHEVSHIRNNDMYVMSLADTIMRLTSALSLFGQILLFLYLPFFLMDLSSIPLIPILLLIFAPNICALLQLALSRTREYQADIEAARLTGDPIGLAQALAKLERQQGGLMERLFLPGRRVPEPSVLRTHPPTEERIRRLRELSGFRQGPPNHRQVHDADGTISIPVHYPRIMLRPGWHINGTWY